MLEALFDHETGEKAAHNDRGSPRPETVGDFEGARCLGRKTVDCRKVNGLAIGDGVAVIIVNKFYVEFRRGERSQYGYAERRRRGEIAEKIIDQSSVKLRIVLQEFFEPRINEDDFHVFFKIQCSVKQCFIL